MAKTIKKGEGEGNFGAVKPKGRPAKIKSSDSKPKSKD